MNRLSIIIPAGRDQRALEDTLVSVLENRPTGCEVLVACSDAYQDPYDLDDEVRFVRAAGERTWVGLANQALMASDASIIHLLLPGTHVEEGWAEAAIDVLRYEEDVCAVAPLLLSNETGTVRRLIGVCWERGGRRRVVSHTGKPGSVRSLAVDGPTKWAGFYRRSDLLRLGGWDRHAGEELADVELSMASRQAGGRCLVIPSCQIGLHTPEASLRASGFLGGLQAERLYWRFRNINHESAPVLTRPLEMLADSARLLPNPTAILRLAGHVTGCLLPGGRVRAGIDSRDVASALPRSDDNRLRNRLDVEPISTSPGSKAA